MIDVLDVVIMQIVTYFKTYIEAFIVNKVPSAAIVCRLSYPPGKGLS